MVPAIIIFAVMYIAMLVFGKYRPYIALGTALIFIVSGMLPLNKIFGEIDFNVLLMIGGTMGLVELFIQSKMPNRLADIIMKKSSQHPMGGCLPFLVCWYHFRICRQRCNCSYDCSSCSCNLQKAGN